MIDEKTSKLKILCYTTFFGRPLTESGVFHALPLAEDWCTVTTDPNSLSDADVVAFHIPDFRLFPPVKREGQLWLSISVEPVVLYPLQSVPEFMDRFDLHLSFRRDSDIPVLYFMPAQIPELLSPPVAKTRQSLAVYFASNQFAPDTRYDFISELMKHMSIDSYGASQKNSKVDKDVGRSTKLETISTYYYYLAFENSIYPDYVSEKLFDGLIAGTVPVYLGALNVADFLPADNCIINVSDYSSVREVARDLIAISQNKERYESYFAWKKKPLKESFLSLISTQQESVFFRLCAKISEHLGEARFQEIKDRLPFEVVRGAS